ncbi:MAG TPA: DNA double-strand break repair nuclease NurA [Acidimicrobiales bacterium]
MASASLSAAAERLAVLLSGAPAPVTDAAASDLEFEPVVTPRPLTRMAAPPEVWAVDGGQATVADARSVQVIATRAARARFLGGECVLEDEGELRAWLVGSGEERVAAASLGLGIAPDVSVDVNLLRDAGEWEAVSRALDEASPGAFLLVDGDLRPDLRIPVERVASLLAAGAERSVTVLSVTKHSSLARGGAPLLGQLELEAAVQLGERAMWWAPVARMKPSVGLDVQVVAARLDPDARFAFRVDLPGDADPEPVLGALSALCDDAAFPGYPYPLTVADRLAACPSWLRHDIRLDLEDHLDLAGVPVEVRDRAFADRHRLMERA